MDEEEGQSFSHGDQKNKIQKFPSPLLNRLQTHAKT